MRNMVLIKMIGWGLVVVVWAIYAVKQALIRDFIGTIIAAFILVLGVVCFRGNRKKWKAKQAEKKAAKANAQKGGDNVTPFPTPEFRDEEAASPEEDLAESEAEPEVEAAFVEDTEVPEAEEASEEEEEPEKIDETAE